MNRPFEIRNKTSIHAKPPIIMNEDSNSEFQLVLSGLQRLDSKIESHRLETKNDFKQVDSIFNSFRVEMKVEFKQVDLRSNSFRAEMKDELKQVHSGIHSMAAELINELKHFATKADLSEMERRNDLRYATKDNLAQTKLDLVKWMFTFWASLVVILLGLYFKK